MAPSFDDVALKVRGLIAESLKRPVDDVRLESALDTQLSMDSLALIKLNVALEETFDVYMPDVTTPAEASLKTVRDVVNMIHGKLVQGGAQ